jgi:membrane-associated protease RseP (regulator of RpoE activity)
MNAKIGLISALVVGVGVANAQGVPPAAPVAPVASAPPVAPMPGDDNAAIESQLQEAQHRLDEAAREVAGLSAQLGGPLVRQFATFGGPPGGRAIIGVQLDETNSKDGAVVHGVSPGGPAAEAGIRTGDVIVSVNGTAVKGDDAAREVVRLLRDVKPESKVAVRVLREGKAKDFSLTARRGPGFMAFAPGLPELPEPPEAPRFNFRYMVHGPLSDMELASLTPKLGHYFGTDKGVLVVRSAPEGGLKLEDGDVILAIDGREPTSGSHATRILSSYQPGEKLTLKVVRDHKTMDVQATVPEPMMGPRGPARESHGPVLDRVPRPPRDHGSVKVLTHHENDAI